MKCSTPNPVKNSSSSFSAPVSSLPSPKKFILPWLPLPRHQALLRTHHRCHHFGILFGAIHGQIWALIPLSIFGILLAILYEKSGSIWAPILCHAMFNSINISSC
ncbi:CPBP family intramembrane glutamic endopeptidase [Rubritalea tangerina]|uniref:CPBP family intramembrane glutamic endopeptidase n=1 Tax=Rubritalea tangerina TaxID=430798 RepID=UPI00361ECE10